MTRTVTFSLSIFCMYVYALDRVSGIIVTRCLKRRAPIYHCRQTWALEIRVYRWISPNIYIVLANVNLPRPHKQKSTCDHSVQALTSMNVDNTVILIAFIASSLCRMYESFSNSLYFSKIRPFLYTASQQYLPLNFLHWITTGSRVIPVTTVHDG